MSSNTRSLPRLMALDVRAEVINAIAPLVPQVTEGCLGHVFDFNQDNARLPIEIEFTLPDLLEHDIYLIDLQTPTLRYSEPTHRQTRLYEPGFWADYSLGKCDTRPASISQLRRDASSTLLAHGAIFIIFIAPETTSGLIHGSQNNSFSKINSWCIHPNLDSVRFLPYEGSEIRPLGSDPLGKMLAGRCSATISIPANMQSEVEILATNRFDKPVAAKWSPTKSEGLVFLLPEVSNKQSLLTFMLSEYLPEQRPALFPSYEGKKWVLREEYSPYGVIDLHTKIETIRTKANQEIADAEMQIAALRDKSQHLSDLLTESGDALVAAVKTTIEALGFSGIETPDESVDITRQDRREDLRFVQDRKTVLVEVKGIAGTPRESAALQVFKYIAPRMKQLGTVDVRGLAIINHQRHIPARDRVTNPFQEDVIINAESHDVGLMTTWDLFRLARAASIYRWPFEMVEPLFLMKGRVQPIPPCFTKIGTLSDIWPNVDAYGIRLTDELRDDSILLFDCTNGLVQASLRSLEVSRKPRQMANPGELAGVRLDINASQISDLRKGLNVYARRP